VERQLLDRHGVRSLLCVPLSWGGNQLGALGLVNPARIGGWAEEDRALLVTAGDVIAGTLRRRDAELRLSESEERFRRLFNSANDAIFLHGVEADGSPGRFLEVNDRALAVLGYSREELLEMRPADIDDPGQKAGEAAAMESLERNGAALFESLHVARDGRRIPVEISAHRFELGGQTLILSLARDISEVRAATAALQASEARLREALVRTIEAVALTVEKRDPYTAGHQQRVAALAVAIGHALGMEAERVEGLRLGALIHDIGKIYVPAEILNRPSSLSPTEMRMVRTHPEVGYEIVRGIDFPWPVAEMIRQHQERHDGSGYPRGLAGAEILPEARIMAVADVVEALCSHRPYRPARGLDAALEELEQYRGTLYAPEAVDACLALFREGRFDPETWSGSPPP
jgi:PAS domain S-box-containing protein/putative nucleotidyltransferase with HDIG domain